MGLERVPAGTLARARPPGLTPIAQDRHTRGQPHLEQASWRPRSPAGVRLEAAHHERDVRGRAAVHLPGWAGWRSGPGSTGRARPRGAGRRPGPGGGRAGPASCSAAAASCYACASRSSCGCASSGHVGLVVAHLTPPGELSFFLVWWGERPRPELPMLAAAAALQLRPPPPQPVWLNTCSPRHSHRFCMLLRCLSDCIWILRLPLVVVE